MRSNTGHCPSLINAHLIVPTWMFLTCILREKKAREHKQWVFHTYLALTRSLLQVDSRDTSTLDSRTVGRVVPPIWTTHGTWAAPLAHVAWILSTYIGLVKREEHRAKNIDPVWHTTHPTATLLLGTAKASILTATSFTTHNHGFIMTDHCFSLESAIGWGGTLNSCCTVSNSTAYEQDSHDS